MLYFTEQNKKIKLMHGVWINLEQSQQVRTSQDKKYKQILCVFDCNAALIVQKKVKLKIPPPPPPLLRKKIVGSHSTMGWFGDTL